MGPFLHAHTGKSHLTGFHKHGLSAQAGSDVLDAIVPSFTAATDSDSAAWEVPTARPRTTETLSWDDSSTHILLWLSVALVAICAHAPLLLRLFSTRSRRHHGYRSRIAPPSQAPPCTPL